MVDNIHKKAAAAVAFLCAVSRQVGNPQRWQRLSLLKDLLAAPAPAPALHTQRQYLRLFPVSNNHLGIAKICAQRAKTNSF